MLTIKSLNYEKNVLLVVLMLAFNAGVYSQDNLVDADILLPAFEGNKSYNKLDKGRVVENGLFFTRSEYGNDLSSNPKGAKKLLKTFEIMVEKNGDYFFAAHIMPANNVEKINKEFYKNINSNSEKVDIVDVSVYVNDKLVGTLLQTKLEWELVSLKEGKMIYLQEGKNVITFESDEPYYPTVDAVRITEKEKDLIVKNNEYDKYISYLDSNPERSLPTEKKTQEEIDNMARKYLEEEKSTPSLRSAIFPHDNSWTATPHVFPNPEGEYNHVMRVPITYTYHRKLYLSAGNHTFRTEPISGNSYYTVDPIMYLYKIDNPDTYSWQNDDYGGSTGYHSRIDVTNIPAGEYYLVIRAYNISYSYSALGSQGLVDVFQDNAILNTNAPVSGYMLEATYPQHPYGYVNYFTAYSTGIPVIWIMNKLSENTHVLKYSGGTNFTMSTPLDFDWSNDARFRFYKQNNNYYCVLVSAAGSANGYFGNCDAYGNVLEGAVIMLGSKPFFPNLKIGDKMISAPNTTQYNCHAWSGGITTGVFDNISRVGVINGHNYGSVLVWSTWDNYFGNSPDRYTGATTYIKNQADAGNGEIALWSYDGTISGVSHTSVRLLANNNPHGYDWESKCGNNFRIFHPRNALWSNNNVFGYGNIIAYYRDASKSPNDLHVYSASVEHDNSERSNLIALRHAARSSSDGPVFTMEESIEKGLTVIEDVQLNDEQMSLVKAKYAKSSGSVLQTLYDDWIKKISSPEMSYISKVSLFLDTEEGKRLIDYGKSNLEESIFFFAKVVFIDDSSYEKYIAEYLFCEIVRDKYAPVIEKIKEDWSKNSYDKSGRYIAPMPETFAKKYIKELLSKSVLRSVEVANKSEEKLINNDILATISPNPVYEFSNINLNLKDKAVVTIKIYSQNSTLIETVLNNKVLESGAHSFSINASNLSKGLYVCVIEMNGNVISRKFLKR